VILEIRAQLTRVRWTGRAERLCISGPPVGIFLALLLSTVILGLPGVANGVYLSVASTLCYCVAQTVLFALQPSDRTAVSIAAAMYVLPAGLRLLYGTLVVRAASASFFAPVCGAAPALFAIILLFATPLFISCWLAAYLIYTLTAAHRPCNGPKRGRPQVPARELLSRLWDSVGATSLAFGLCELCSFAVSSTIWPSYPSEPQGILDIVSAAIFGVVSVLSLWPRARRWMIALLTRRGGAVSTAAGVSQLIGHMPVDMAVAVAQRRFRAVHLADIGPWVFDQFPATAAPRPLRGLAAHADLGSVDAFISHSGQDPPAERWDALCRWHARFVREQGREPTMFIDRVCMDQGDPSHDVPLLPVYIAG